MPFVPLCHIVCMPEIKDIIVALLIASCLRQHLLVCVCVRARVCDFMFQCAAPPRCTRCAAMPKCQRMHPAGALTVSRPTPDDSARINASPLDALLSLPGGLLVAYDLHFLKCLAPGSGRQATAPAASLWCNPRRESMKKRVPRWYHMAPWHPPLHIWKSHTCSPLKIAIISDPQPLKKKTTINEGSQDPKELRCTLRLQMRLSFNCSRPGRAPSPPDVLKNNAQHHSQIHCNTCLKILEGHDLLRISGSASISASLFAFTARRSSFRKLRPYLLFSSSGGKGCWWQKVHSAPVLHADFRNK